MEGKEAMQHDVNRLLTFFIEEEQYGLNINNVKEIIHLKASYRINNLK